MSEELEVLKIVTQRLNKADIPYMISGSIAANYYAVPRMTRDIDIVIELKQGDIDRFTGLFGHDFYVNQEMIINEVLREGMFNLIHNQYIFKIDFIIKKSSEYQQTAFSRRKEILIEGRPMWYITVEDLVISKLMWAKDSHSEMQLRDVRNLIETAKDLDVQYMEYWLRQLGLTELYTEAKNERYNSWNCRSIQESDHE